MSHLCDNCSNLDYEKLKDTDDSGKGQPHGKNLGELQLSAELQGCRLCTFLWRVTLIQMTELGLEDLVTGESRVWLGIERQFWRQPPIYKTLTLYLDGPAGFELDFKVGMYSNEGREYVCPVGDGADSIG